MSQKGYPPSEAFHSGFLPVGDIHKLHYSQHGNPKGKPVLFLHGGPGGQTSPENTAFFNPAIYHIILLDQRGSGKSTPHAEVRENTSQHLVSDLETLRQHLSIPKWHLVFGGSWGSCLALLYAQTHPQAVGSLLIRGIFTCRASELEYVYHPLGPAMLYPDHYAQLLEHVAPEDRSPPAKLVETYGNLLLSEDVAVREAAARRWAHWELSISKVSVPESDYAQLEDAEWSLSHGRMETHYFRNGAFLEEGQLLKKANVDRIRHIPCK